MAGPIVMSGIAVVIVNWNAGQLLTRCLRAVSRQTLRPDRVIVADNASSDDSLLGLQEVFPDIEILKFGENLGFAAANNRAIERISDCSWVALLNPDTEPEPDWLDTLARAAAANPGASFFASLLLMHADRKRVDGAGDSYHVSGLAWRRCHSGLLAHSRLESREVFSPCAAGALYRLDALRSVDGFEESFFCYFEDVDLSFRLRLQGHRCLFVPDSIVYHVGSGTTGVDSDFSVYHGHRNLVWTFFRNMPTALLLLYLPYHLLMNVVALLVYTSRGRGRVILRSKVDALRGLPRALAQRRHIQERREVSSVTLRSAMARGVALLFRRQHDC